MYRIGIDIGGTNTDAVLVNEKNEIIKVSKTATTDDIVSGFTKAISEVWQNNEFIIGVFAGTTHAINALLQAKNLNKVGVIRLSGCSKSIIPPCFDWPEKLKNNIFVASHTVDGGYECDGSVITKLNEYNTRKKMAELVEAGAEGLAVTGVFSSLYPKQELKVKKWICEDYGVHFPSTLSHEIGDIGIIERENAAILNTALQKTVFSGFKDLQGALYNLGLNCSLFITQNNGTLMTLEKAQQYPILTLAAGPINSFVGATKLAGIMDGVVADIGGTSTDVGVIVNGFARRSYKMAKIAGIKPGFSMPDISSIGLGGGSHVTQDCPINIGPLSVGNFLLEKARSFGGDTLTLTDVAIACDALSISGAQACIGKKMAEKILNQAYQQIMKLYQKMAGFHVDLPLLLVGGGAYLFPKNLLANNVIIPSHAGSANAFGAALSEIGSTVNTVIGLKDREVLMKQLEEEALEKAKNQGAYEPRIINRQIIPYHYTPDNIARVIITAAGSIKVSKYARETMLSMA